jgi:predicted aspartyl protease
MKPILSLLILVLAISYCSAQSLNSGGPTEKAFYQELPFEQINGKIIIDVEIAGHIHKFLLDTGAPFTISDEIAAELGITPAKQSSMVDAYGNMGATKVARIESIKLGNIDFKNVTAFVGTNLIFKCIGVEGNIGSNLLRNTSVRFNTKNKTITITDDASKLSLNTQNSVSLNTHKDKQSSPFFILEVAKGVTGDYFIDTGDSGFLSLSNTYMDIFKSHNACEILATGYGSNSFGENGAENNNVKHRVVFPAIKLGNAVFKNVKAETVFSNNGSGNNSIGVKLLDYGILTLDYINGKLYFDPFTPDADLAEKSWSLSPTYSDGKLLVGVVWDKLKDKVKPGQQIIAIDGVSCEHVEVCSLLTQKSLLQGREQATLTIKDEKGNLSQLIIVKE